MGQRRPRMSDKSEHVKDAFISLHSSDQNCVQVMREFPKMNRSTVTKCLQFSPFVEIVWL